MTDPANTARDKALQRFFDLVSGRLIVSVQAYPGEPLRDPATIARMCQAVVAGGAAAVRVQGLADVQYARSAVEVPVIGLWKSGSEPVSITPTPSHAVAVGLAGAHVVALDATGRQRPDGSTVSEAIRRVHEQTDSLVMADCGCLDDAVAAVEAGADMVGTTLAGYSGVRAMTEGPDWELVEQIAAADLGVPLIAEGRYRTGKDAARALGAGADSVVIGTAITHPTSITRWMSAEMTGARP